MNKLLEFFKKIPNAYYNWKKRNEQLSEFLNNCKDSGKKLTHIETVVTELQKGLTAVNEKVDVLEQQTCQINGRLEIVGMGTKMELFDTLHHQRVRLVIKKGWASPEEKREIESIYHIYHDELHGNGQGERYYNEIMALPESEEELLKQKGDLNGKIQEMD